MEYISDAQAKQMMILEVGRRMYQGGFVGSERRNISCKVGDNEIWRLLTGVSKGFMTEDMLVKLDLDGMCWRERTSLPARSRCTSEYSKRTRGYRASGACASVDSYGFWYARASVWKSRCRWKGYCP